MKHQKYRIDLVMNNEKKIATFKTNMTTCPNINVANLPQSPSFNKKCPILSFYNSFFLTYF